MEVPDKVVEQFKEVRDTGRTNMIDRIAVQRIANEMNLFKLVTWIEENKRNYTELLKAVENSAE